MDHEDRVLLREAFARVQEAPAGERPALLSALKPAVRAEVESLLDALETGDPLPFAGNAVDEGSRVGAYLVRELLGSGGMGMVYRAERQDGEFLREVALKVAGGRMFAPEAARRFIRERQILAGLDHPNIVRLIDGGVVRGQRYVVMELVRGVPITTYARELALPRRLDLFLRVCAAVQHAHQKLILHRDLKAGNILVTAQGEVKVLDFGIAQLVENDTGGMGGTETSAHPFSLVCASPEQLRGEPLTLASDVYSLGVLLYELVTGVNPQHREGDTFQQVFTRATAETAKAPSKINREIRRDLDAIAWKALAREPARRYASVGDLMNDVERYLAARQVSAMPPGWLYRFTQFVRRNRAGTALASLLVAGALLGGAVYIRQARHEARRSVAARRLVHSVLFDIQPKLNSIAATLPLRKTLVEETLRYLEAVSADAGNDTGLLQEIARAYLQLANVLGTGGSSNLGDHAGARQAYLRAEQAITRALRSAPNQYDVLSDAAAVHHGFAYFLQADNNQAEAVSQSNREAALARRVFALRPRERKSREALASSLFTRGSIFLRPDWQQSVASFVEAGRHYSDLAQEFPAHLRNVGLTERYLMAAFSEHGQSAESLEHARRAFAISEQRFGANPNDPQVQVDYGIDMSQLGTAIELAVGPKEALPYYEKSLRLREQIAARDPLNASARGRWAVAALYYGVALRELGEWRRARAALAKSVELYSALKAQGQLEAGNDQYFGRALLNAGQVERQLGNGAGACAQFERAGRLFQSAGKGGPLNPSSKRDQGVVRDLAEHCRMVR